MKGYVVDASIVVKWLVQEQWSDKASRLLEAEATLIAPELLFAEVCNALWAAHRRRDIGPQDLADAIDALKAAPIGVPFSTRELAASSTRLAVDLDHPVYDCFYLALAIQEQYRVVTADGRFHRKVSGHPYLADRITHLASLDLD
ncbi:MAG: type II toxin-antitoxin system VapC family toxin [Acidobacteriia bacterium]|nr:type II toxin-antitoxin system VapC family toxin [Terriglobia bacterium]